MRHALLRMFWKQQSHEAMSSRADNWKPAVVRAVASEGRGIEECAAVIEKYHSFLQASPFQKSRSVQIQRDRLLEVVQSQIVQRLMRQAGTEERLERLAQEVADRRTDPLTAAEELLDRFE